jgi:RimJ/RimL family protein N-acetyltransferase
MAVMERDPDDVVLTTARTRLRSVSADDVATLHAIRRSAAVSRWWSQPEDGWPLGGEDGVTAWTIELVDAPALGPPGAVVGFVQAWEGVDPDYDECGIDLCLAPSVHRQGLGREVVTAVRDWLVHDRGHHLVQIDPAADNVAAIACYAACGFQRVGILPRRERDTDGQGWHDTLLMAYATDPRTGRARDR